MRPSLSRRTRRSGFTLLELIVTIVVLGILAALAVPVAGSVMDRSRDATLAADLESMGRGVAALAAFESAPPTVATAEAFLQDEADASGGPRASSGRWDLYADGTRPDPADGDLLAADADGYVGFASTVPHRGAGYVAYMISGSAGAAAAVASYADAELAGVADPAELAGADALCYFGVPDDCEGAEGVRVPGSPVTDPGDDGDGGDVTPPEPEVSGTMVLRYDTSFLPTNWTSIPIYGTNVTIDWGDGTDPVTTTSNAPMHQFVTDGIHTVTVEGTFDSYGSNASHPNRGLIEIVSWDDDLGVTSFNNAFKNSEDLLALPSYLPSTVTDLSQAFENNNSFDGDLAGWDTSNVTNMAAMFHDAHAFNSDISGWDTSNVTTMYNMFFRAHAFDQDLSGWNVDAVTNYDGFARDANSSWQAQHKPQF